MRLFEVTSTHMDTGLALTDEMVEAELEEEDICPDHDDEIKGMAVGDWFVHVNSPWVITVKRLT